MVSELDFNARYRVKSWNLAVAVYPVKYKTEKMFNPVFDEDGEYTGWDDYEEVEDHDWVYVTMVGDDAKHLVEIDDLEMISEDDYCPGCGQIGCKAHG